VNAGQGTLILLQARQAVYHHVNISTFGDFSSSVLLATHCVLWLSLLWIDPEQLLILTEVQDTAGYWH
jgi:hypothetical protein